MRHILRNKKIVLILALTLLVLGILIFYRNYLTHTFKRQENIYHQFHKLNNNETELQYSILKTALYLYSNYDEVVLAQNRLAADVTQMHTLLQRYHYNDLEKDFVHLQTLIQKQSHAIEQFKTLNATLKNSIVFLYSYLDHLPPTLPLRTKRTIIETISEILIALYATDPSIEDEIARHYRQLLRLLDYDNKQEMLFIAHIHTFLHNFSPYVHILESILSPHIKKSLHHIEKRFYLRTRQEISYMNIFFTLVLLLFIGTSASIILLLYRLDRENSRLTKLKEHLAHNAITDDLTHLCNRRAYKHDVRYVSQPFFALVNINGFRHYNDFYGNKMGDHILRQTAKILREYITPHYDAKLYRLGGDDFGILIEETHPIDAHAFARALLELFRHHSITFKNIEIYLSISIGISRKRPLLETADMALKHVKKKSPYAYMIYNDSLGVYDQFKINIQRSKTLQKAIENDAIEPFFQPIVENTTGKIIKYEALARIKKEDGSHESIYPYLSLAKEFKLYSHITKQILQKSIAFAMRYKKDISINLSIKDIEDPQTLKLFGELFARYPDAPRLLTFELLESDAIYDYTLIKDFISIIHTQGCSIALDDFGSGYSNFAHILNLSLDYIKIDGSLIRALPIDTNARLVVRAIVELAQEAQLKTVAEFVDSYEVLQEVQRLGIDYSQGYLFSPPVADITSLPTAYDILPNQA